MENKNNNLKVGETCAKIFIPDNFFPYRRFFRRMYKGQHDDLHARVIIIGNSDTNALILSRELGDLRDTDVWLGEGIR